MNFTDEQLIDLIRHPMLPFMIPEMKPFQDSLNQSVFELSQAVMSAECTKCVRSKLEKQYKVWENNFLATVRVFLKNNRNVENIAVTLLMTAPQAEALK